VGSALTYGRRYQLAAFLGISSEDDNDANNPDDKPVKQQQNTDKPPQRKPKKPLAAAKKKPKATQRASKHDWKQLSKEHPEIKKVCDVLSRGGFDIDENTIYVEAGSMNRTGKLTDKELDTIEVITGRKPA
jgi:hypothetical protein